MAAVGHVRRIDHTILRRDERIDCRACHMPKVESHNDRASKRESSLRIVAGCHTRPRFYGQTEQVKKTVEFLQRDLVNVDIFSVTNETTGATQMQLQQRQPNNFSVQRARPCLLTGNKATATSVIRFAEVRDLYEIWVEFKATDGDGQTVFQSGFLKPDLFLDESAHTYKAILLDSQSRPSRVTKSG